MSKPVRTLNPWRLLRRNAPLDSYTAGSKAVVKVEVTFTASSRLSLSLKWLLVTGVQRCALRRRRLEPVYAVRPSRDSARVLEALKKTSTLEVFACYLLSSSLQRLLVAPQMLWFIS